MSKINPEDTAPPRIWELVWEILEEISDESGEDNLGNSYLLKYEGWGGHCVEKIWDKVTEKQGIIGININSQEAKEEGGEACHEYAREQSYKIINDEWKPQLMVRGYRFIEGGYDNGGLYGRTWALFTKDV